MIAVVMGCESSKARIKDARTLLDYGFSNCQRIHSETTRKEIGRIPVQKGQRSEVSCQEKVTADLIDIKTQKGKIVKKIKIDSVKAPVKKGQKIVFIHGKGDGVLRKAILQELKYKYKNYQSQDASFREYGFGATMVTIR